MTVSHRSSAGINDDRGLLRSSIAVSKEQKEAWTINTTWFNQNFVVTPPSAISRLCTSLSPYLPG